ncbi:hypothetical protein NDI45_28995 [Leptolyngbya sp. GB1-A1]|uniref:hypothetical protein n=1 Tax=Leptolyngbya sp. GB1-A1 TaxID=2933908 RepID=UPI003298AAD6
MDQLIINITKKEYFHPRLIGIEGSALNQLAGRAEGESIRRNTIDIYPSTPQALFMLVLTSDHESYKAAGMSEKTIGRWAGDQVAVISEFSDDMEDSALYDEYYKGHKYHDISPLVRLMFEATLPIKYSKDHYDRYVFNWRQDDD